MTKITRSDFIQHFANKAIDVKDVKQENRDNLWRAGKATVWALRQADVNGDGKISGANEVSKLFDVVDTFDKNGARESISTTRADGSMTNSGKVFSVLNLQISEASPTTQVTPGEVDTPVVDTPTVDTPTIGEVETPTVDVVATPGELFAKGGADSIDSKMGAHLKSLEETGVGLYYGDHSDMNSMNRGEMQAWIDGKATDRAKAPSASELRKSSCIGWAMENVEAAYKAAGKTARWNEIEGIMRRDDMRGTTLAKELQKDGWESVYWNGDTSNTSHNGEHSFSASQVRKGRPYYGVKVDHQVLNYERGDMSGIDKLEDVPFFFGLARGGTHTFVGRDGNVNEFHWSHMPDSDTAIEETPLKDWGWGSGLIMVPPGSWPKG